MPPDQGIAIGAGAVTHVVVSRHFYNPTGMTGVADTGAGFRLTVTPSLRAKERAQLVMSTAQIVVPPHT